MFHAVVHDVELPGYAPATHRKYGPTLEQHFVFQTRNEASFAIHCDPRDWVTIYLHSIDPCDCDPATTTPFERKLKDVQVAEAPIVVRTPQPILTRSQRLALANATQIEAYENSPDTEVTN